MSDDEPAAGAAADRLQLAVESVLGNVFCDGNDVQVLRNGDEIFPPMLEAIARATRTIDFVTFVYWAGSIADRFADALSRRAEDGVRVRVVLDALGSAPMDPGLLGRMRDAGVLVERFRPVVRWKMWESDHRTHRKILVCDDEVAFTGGVGVADEWLGDARTPQEWRDTHFRVTGPAVLGLRAAFLADWRDIGHAIDRADISVRRPERTGDMRLAVVDGSAQIGVNGAERLLEAVVVAAEQRIVVQTPYFNPTEELVESLVGCRDRGVDVDVVVPGPHIDKRISAVVAEEQYVPLTDHGIRVWVYQRSMMHAKVVLVDDSLAVVGSVNVNRRSVEKDEEVAVCILDPEVVATLGAHAEADIAASVPASPRDVEERTLVDRALSVATKPIRHEM